MIRKILVSIAVAGSLVLISHDNAMADDAKGRWCGSFRPCELTGGSTCHPPSSLMPAYEDPAYNYYRPGEDGRCGFETCWRIVCPCGDPVATAECTGPECIPPNESSPVDK